jgi:hypothetical protein
MIDLLLVSGIDGLFKETLEEIINHIFGLTFLIPK